MFRTALAALAVSAAALTGTAVTAHAAGPATAVQATCRDFSQWEAHRTSVNLDAMLAASLHAPWRSLAWDVTGLYSDVRSGAAARWITAGIRYVTVDCAVAGF